MSSLNPPPAPVIALIVPNTSDTPNTRPKLMGRKCSSVYFQQPGSDRSSSSSSSSGAYPNDDRTFFISVNGDMMLNIGGLGLRTSKHSKAPNGPAILESIPDLSLPEPAATCAVVGYKCRVDVPLAKGVESVDNADNGGRGDGDDQGLEMKGVKRRDEGRC